jgi:NAD(P)-dependent dehydrogenase (short-subunit alcohol dehydrogenase family)
MVFNLAGRKCLVFGGSSGIGLAACKSFLEHGATVIAISRNPPSAPLTAGIAHTICDVRDRAALATLFQREAPFDVLVSTATGGDRAIGPFLQMDLDGFQASFDKLWGYANVVRLGAEHLKQDGCIVLVSGAPARKCKPGQVALASVGGAVENFARAVAPELVPRRLNVVSPGVIATPMFGAGDEMTAKVAAMSARNVIPRAGTPEEVAQAILFVVQNEFVTGTTVDVDGGWLCQPPV